MLDKFGTFRNMSHTDMREWKEFKGLGPVAVQRKELYDR
jgi:DNA repair protein RadC